MLDTTIRGPKLFAPDANLPGILKCRVCCGLFITGAYLAALTRELAAHGRPTAWLGTPEAEQARRKAHAMRHVRDCEATFWADGFFYVRVAPTIDPTARDFGFTAVST